MRLKKGYFITFEGGEGSGKSTQIKRLARMLRERGLGVRVLREPGGTRVGEAIRDILLDKELMEMAPHAELLLYLAARAQIVCEKIRPALGRGEIVILDRFEYSTLAYQGFGRGLALTQIEMISRWFVRGDLNPDITFLLDIDPRAGLARGKGGDRMEKQTLSFHQRVRQGYLHLAKRDPRRFCVIAGEASREAVFEKIKERILRVLRKL